MLQINSIPLPVTTSRNIKKPPIKKKIQNIGEFGVKKYFINHQTANTIQLIVPIKRKFFGSIIFQNKLEQRGVPQGLLDKYSHLFICSSLK